MLPLICGSPLRNHMEIRLWLGDHTDFVGFFGIHTGVHGHRFIVYYEVSRTRLIVVSEIDCCGFVPLGGYTLSGCPALIYDR